MANENNGFTLVELSIVLIIIGLIISGVLAGKSLIRSAQLQTVLQDLDKYKTAVNTFQLKYGDAIIPGDMSDASSYFTGAIDGDGDGIMECTTNILEESAGFWQHLSLAGMIKGDYDGDWAGCVSSDALVVGEDMPKGAVDASHFNSSIGPVYGINFVLGILFAGSSNPYVSNTFVDGIITSIEAKAIDIKIDDGIANTGKVLGLKTRLMWGVGAYDGYCTLGSGHPGNAGTNYNLSDEGNNCLLVLIINK